MPPAVRLNVPLLAGVTVFSTRPARIEWTPEGRLRLVEVDTETERVVLDVPAGQLSKASFTAPYLRLWSADGRTFRVDLSQAVPSPYPGEALAPYNARVAVEGMPGLDWWRHQLQASGVPVTHHSTGRMMLYAGAGALAVVGLILVGVLIFG